MTILKFSMKEIPIVPKPRGQMNRQGRMTHALNGYGKYRKEINRVLTKSDFRILPNYFAFIYHIKVKPKAGQQPDCSNLIGSFEDGLVKAGLIKDDNWRVIPNAMFIATESKHLPFSQLDFYQVDSLVDFLKCVIIIFGEQSRIKILTKLADIR